MPNDQTADETPASTTLPADDASQPKVTEGTVAPEPAATAAPETGGESAAQESAEQPEQAQPAVVEEDAPVPASSSEIPAEQPAAADQSQPAPQPPAQPDVTTTDSQATSDANDGTFQCGTTFEKPHVETDPVLMITADSLERYISLMDRPVVNDASVKAGITIIAQIVDRVLKKPSDAQMEQIRDFIVKHQEGAMHPRNALRGINKLDRNIGPKVECFMGLMLGLVSGESRRISTTNANKILGSVPVLQWIQANSKFTFVEGN